MFACQPVPICWNIPCGYMMLTIMIPVRRKYESVYLCPLRSRRLCSSRSAPIAAERKLRGPSVCSVALKWQGTQQHGEAGAHDELVGMRSVVLKSVCLVVLK